MRKLPTGTVSFVFTDIEGSTRLIQRLGTGHREVLETHARLLRKAITEAGGIEVGERGDGFFFVFVSACDAAKAAARVQRSLAKVFWGATTTWDWRSIGLHVSATQGMADRSSCRNLQRRCCETICRKSYLCLIWGVIV